MTAHNAQYFGLAASANMVSDELFPDANSTTKYNSRIDTPLRDGRQSNGIPNLAPASPCISEDSDSMAARIASKIEYKYHVDRRVLGTGQTGTVRECIDCTTGERFAVKSIRKNDPAVKPGSLAREIKLLQAMKHSSIVQLVDMYEDADYMHIVTDLCEGGELFDKIIEKATNGDTGAVCFAEDEAARVIYQILTSVSYMHKRGIVHRDLKPENILFSNASEDSPIKIIDFGLARQHNVHQGEAPMSTMVGTTYYMAPEVQGKKYDKSCDLWSVGVIAYVMLSGAPPFNGANNNEVYAAVRRGRYRFPSSTWSRTSRESRDFICRLMQRDPRKRMPIEQALNHPWMARHMHNNLAMSYEDEQDNSSVEVVLEGASRGSIICDSVEKHEVRVSLFAVYS
mmetsp:Transcript_23492/g.38137  ORF Transcript_23492/g.38137 Transcript_23492/m.38137 type:complete len:398 (+) Transcript_23492:187-1380(+)|eukprot:CAMPEP_0196142758 /NCGR_PEP_ID=MMETSP0910-20130528/12245_1 /TAXON_ID=49265 /ORGANISM="Thalassiosira rotula, Strain GSO102" /LENGTH=397 /DNA_ID=CAMNT_0041404119 /DNA_START=208 /DNA_END=1401 /DNA_ORIENTATION=+